MNAAALRTDLSVIVKYRIRIGKTVALADRVTPSSGLDEIDQRPQPQGVERLLHSPRKYTALPEVVGIGDEHGPLCDPQHLLDDARRRLDVVQYAELAHEVERVILERQRERVTRDEILPADAVAVSDIAQLADRRKNPPPRALH